MSLRELELRWYWAACRALNSNASSDAQLTAFEKLEAVATNTVWPKLRCAACTAGGMQSAACRFANCQCPFARQKDGAQCA